MLLRESEDGDGIEEEEWVSIFLWKTREVCFSERVTFKLRAE